MKNNLVVFYRQSARDGLILDGNREHDEIIIIKNVRINTGISPIKVKKLVDKCKTNLRRTFMIGQLEDHVLNAANKVRSIENYEAI